MSRTKATSDLWWKNGVFYCLDIQTYLDSDGDGCGDIAGLHKRIDYLAGLGVTCIWLMPFYPSPDEDDGYDIVDFYGVQSRLGTLGDVVELIRGAGDRGIRVIADLVVNHTSIEHPWFQSARSSRDSPYRDFYVWRDERPERHDEDVMLPDQEDSNWTYDERAGQWYLHRFLSDQPELNLSNPEVHDEIAQIAGFWLQLGISGFRVDAVPFLIDSSHSSGGKTEDRHDLLADLRAYLARRKGDAVTLGEVNLPPEEQREFFGAGGRNELDMIFNFHVNQKMFLALARQDAAPLREAVERLPEIPVERQWANFVRSHDELTLDQLSDEEREEVFAAFGPSEEFQVQERGLRRRLPSMLGGDERRIRMVYSLAFSLPGTPVLFYGEEIGMAENLDLEGRLAVRSPMQWSAERNAGFSTRRDGELERAVTEAEGFGPAEVNVISQQRDPGSLLNWFERLIRCRKGAPELGWGRPRVIDTDQPSVFAHRSEWSGSTVVAIHHLGEEPISLSFELEDLDGDHRLVDLLGPELEIDPGPDGRFEFELEPFGHRWLQLQRKDVPVGL